MDQTTCPTWITTRPFWSPTGQMRVQGNLEPLVKSFGRKSLRVTHLQSVEIH
jgi:hypothetical protein